MFITLARASQRDVKNHSLWMFMDAADSLFVVSYPKLAFSSLIVASPKSARYFNSTRIKDWKVSLFDKDFQKHETILKN